MSSRFFWLRVVLSVGLLGVLVLAADVYALLAIAASSNYVYLLLAVLVAFGDRILMAQFDGRIWKRNGQTYRLIKDKSVIAVVEQPAALSAAA